MFPYLLLISGLALLLIGGDSLVRGAVALAERSRLPPLLVGLTVVAFGTSAPEMFVSVDAALQGAGGIAIGNVIGSNIANSLLVLGLPSIIQATRSSEKGTGRNLLAMLGVSALFAFMLLDGNLTRLDGTVLLALFVAFLYVQYRSAISHRRQARLREYADAATAAPIQGVRMTAALLAFGLVSLPLGAELTVSGASSIASALGISDAVIGLTVIALGTSLPELATSMLAAWRRHHAVTIGNVVGSNIFNIAAIMGVSAAIVPMAVAERLLTIDLWVMLATTVVIAVLAQYRIAVGLRLGAAMTLAYLAYLMTSFLLT
jgi:cation:H+ antiporter